MLDHLTTIGRPERPSLPAKVVIHATHRGFFGLRPQNDISLSSYEFLTYDDGRRIEDGGWRTDDRTTCQSSVMRRLSSILER